MTYQNLSFTVSGAVATICLQRPDAGNTFNLELAKEFESVVRDCMYAESVRVVVITGSGKLFSGGGDLKYMQDNSSSIDKAIKELADTLHSAYSMLARMEKPVVVGVNGTAAGIGLSLALLGDVIISVDKAKFATSYVGIGFSPDGGLTYTLPRLIGDKRARELILTNRVLSAHEALDWGMITTVVTTDEFEPALTSLADKLAHGPGKALGDAKRLLRNTHNETLESQMHSEGLALASNSASPDGREGVDAFANGRKPEFNK